SAGLIARREPSLHAFVELGLGRAHLGQARRARVDGPRTAYGSVDERQATGEIRTEPARRQHDAIVRIERRRRSYAHETVRLDRVPTARATREASRLRRGAGSEIAELARGRRRLGKDPGSKRLAVDGRSARLGRAGEPAHAAVE